MTFLLQRTLFVEVFEHLFTLLETTADSLKHEDSLESSASVLSAKSTAFTEAVEHLCQDM